MPRSRIIRPEFWSDEKLASVSRESRLTFAGMWGTSDDYGVTKGNLAWLKSQIFPYDEDIKLSKFTEWITELEKLKRIIPFTSDGEKYYYIPKFEEHQKVDRPSKTRNPEPPTDIDSRLTRDNVASHVEKKVLLTDTITDTDTDTISAAPPSDATPTIITIPISGNGFKEFSINQKMISEWAESYPGIDVLQELRKCREWNRADPKRQKTKQGIVRHIVSWLNRAQDKYKPNLSGDTSDDRFKNIRGRV